MSKTKNVVGVREAERQVGKRWPARLYSLSISLRTVITAATKEVSTDVVSKKTTSEMQSELYGFRSFQCTSTIKHRPDSAYLPTETLLEPDVSLASSVLVPSGAKRRYVHLCIDALGGQYLSLTDLEKVTIFYNIMHGLVYLYAKGYIHRDIKPRNITIAFKPLRAVIIDVSICTKE